jgi:PAS domain S-box-containing protein
MTASGALAQVVFTDNARCRDCYRCLRACPVKAIAMHDGQARVAPERCIACGTCIRECPQGAKHYREDAGRAERLLESDAVVCASIAPSFASAFDGWAGRRLPSALRQLGFAYVGETAIGAHDVALATAALVNQGGEHGHVCSACPAVVNYVEQYQPDLVPRLAPVVSPMIAHAKRLEARYGTAARVVFIGPCVAKKSEAERPEHAGLIDVALTFEELRGWLERSGVDLKRCEESAFDEAPGGAARFFPVPGGLARTARLETGLFDTRVRTASGFDELADALDQVRQSERAILLEPLFCPQGCVHGPGMPLRANRFVQRDRLVAYADAAPGAADTAPLRACELAARYVARPADPPAALSEAAITGMLETLGRGAAEDQLNCGACGYDSCRQKAIAVLRGMAEAEMCIPRMRQLAERRTDRIIETSPNGIVILDSRLEILGMNPAFRRMFTTSDAVLGKPIAYLFDPEPFERVAAGEIDTLKEPRRYPSYNMTCHQVVYALRDEGQYVGIFVDTTANVRNEQALRDLRSQTEAQARELLEHQINMSQQIAKLLGESSAKGEALVRTLLELAGEQDEERRDTWRDIYTST